MKAAVFYGPHQPLRIEEVADPKPGAGEILVRVAACGVCHTDLHYIEHGVPTFKKPPLILGHEPAGTVAELGAGVTNFKVGDRVLLPATFPCGACFYCRTGRGNICANLAMLGNNVDGAYAELIAVRASEAFPLPDAIPLEEGSIIADALSTPYHAVKDRAQVRPGDTVVVFGCGGVGINVVQIAAAAGASVIGVDLSARKREWAKQFGASDVFDPGAGDVVRSLRRLTRGGPDIVVEAIGNPATIAQGYELVRPGGRLCVIGYTNEPLTISPAKLMYREVEIVGSLGCRPVDYPPLIEMVRTGKIQLRPLVTHRFPLAEIAEAFEVMKRGESLRSIVIP